MDHSDNNERGRRQQVLIMTGQNHRTTPLDIRELLAFDEERAVEAIHTLQEMNGIRECAVLSTCNRSEVYAVTDSVDAGLETLEKLYLALFRIDREQLTRSLYRKANGDAVKQMFAVAAGLDSMVLGEPQILGQVKDSYALALRTGSLGTVMNKLFTRALEVGKRVRSETSIGAGAVSVPFAAVEVVKGIFDRFETRTALVIGAGEMGVLAAKHLKSAGFRSILVINRTFERGRKLAEEVNGTPLRFEQMDSALSNADVVISCTSASEPVLRLEHVEPVLKRRKSAPLFLMDLAVPRDIDPDIARLSGLFLYDIDDLQSVVDRNRTKREIEAKKGQAIVDEEVSLFHNWLASLDTSDTIRRLRSRFEEIGMDEAERFSRTMTDEQRSEYLRFTRGLLNKILHHPTVRLKKLAEGGGDPNDQRLIRDLFRLDEKEDK